MANYCVTYSLSSKQYRDFLEERMDPDFGLLDIMHANGTIGWREMENVASKSSSCKRNSKLMDYIFARDKSDGLIVALRDADQTHIANYLTANGEYSDEFGEDWPLTTKAILKIDTNHISLVYLLELTDLLGLLYSSKVINSRQKDSISAKPTSHEKNNTLLGILRRRSLRDYRETITCLHQSKQSHIAEVLECGGVVVRVHAHLDGESVTETENEIVTMFANILIDRSIDQPSRILELVQHKVIAAKTGQSIVLYIYCKTIEELQEIYESLISGRLKDSVELCFNSLLNRSQKIAVAALTVTDDEFEKMRMYLKDPVEIKEGFLDVEENPSDALNWMSVNPSSSSSSSSSSSPSDYERCLRLHHRELVNGVEATHIMDYLFQKQLLTLDDLQLIPSFPIQSHRMRCLLTAIYRRMYSSPPETVFRHFLLSLADDYSFLERKLREALEQPETAEGHSEKLQQNNEKEEINN